MKEIRLKLKQRKDICENTVAFIFDTNKKKYFFEAGQYAHFTIPNPVSIDKKGHSRPLSFASSPHHKNSIMIAARTGSSAFVKNLCLLPIGSEVIISKPMGNLKLPGDKSSTTVFIAGGIGITPIRSIIDKILFNKFKSKMFLFYSNRSRMQSAFINDFKKWQIKNPNFKFIPVIEDLSDKKWNYEFGFVDKKLLKKYLKNLNDKIFYVVGPPAMVNAVKADLISENADPKKIITEKFK